MGSRGFFTIAQGDVYHRAAYALALSLKASQNGPTELTVGTTAEELTNIPTKYRQVVRYEVLPWADHAANSQVKFENEWKAIYASPYEETIKLDADMLFLTDISDWWDWLSLSEGVFVTKPVTYRGELITSDFYRKTFTESQLPNIYTAFFYFKKSEPNFELFKLAEFIFNHWERCFYEWLQPEHRPEQVSTDVVFALAAKVLNYVELNNLPTAALPTFVHMKSYLQHWPAENLPADWTKTVPISFSRDCKLRIGNHVQQYPFHYQVKEFLTDRLISLLERKAGVC